MTGIAAVASFPTAAQAFTQKQCNVIDTAFTRHTQANFQHYSPSDNAELGKFSNWLDAGCATGQPIVLVRHPEVGAALNSVQTLINAVPDASLRVALSPTVSFVPPSTPSAVRPTTAIPSQRDNAPISAPTKAPGG